MLLGEASWALHLLQKVTQTKNPCSAEQVSLDVVHYFAVQTWRAGSQCHSKVNYVAICTAGITCARHFCNCWLEKWGLLWAKMWLEFWYMVYFCCLCANNWAGVSNWSSSSGIHWTLNSKISAVMYSKQLLCLFFVVIFSGIGFAWHRMSSFLFFLHFFQIRKLYNLWIIYGYIYIIIQYTDIRLFLPKAVTSTEQNERWRMIELHSPWAVHPLIALQVAWLGLLHRDIVLLCICTKHSQG